MEVLEGHNKFYVNDADGNQVAEIVFVPTGEHLSIIEHTDVDPSLKGQGVGKDPLHRHHQPPPVRGQGSH